MPQHLFHTGELLSGRRLRLLLSGGELFLLQSRNVTTLEEAEAYEELLQTTRADLAASSARMLKPPSVITLRSQ